MQSLPILLIVASQGYQPVEYGLTKQVLEKNNFNVAVASDQQSAVAHTPSEPKQLQLLAKNPDFMKVEKTLPLTNIKLVDYQAIFIIGGPGAIKHLNTQIVKDLMKQAAQKNMPFGAICISPRILAEAGLLSGKQATGWDGDNQLTNIFKQHHVIYVQKPSITDGNIITANGPSAAEAFGEAIVQLLKK